MNFFSEEGDLAFVVVFVVEVSIAAQTAAGDAFNLVDFLHRRLAGRLAMVADEIMFRRQVNADDFHFDRWIYREPLLVQGKMRMSASLRRRLSQRSM